MRRTGDSEVSAPSSGSVSSTSSDDGPLVVVSGPSGVGKSTVLRHLGQLIGFGFSVSATTRDPRPNEADGVDYHFVTRPEFEQMIAAGDFIEWAEYGGNLYGTPVTSIAEARSRNRLTVLDIELEGARQVKDRFPDALLIWIEPPGFSELERRLRGRNDTDHAAVERRLERARRDSVLAPEVFDRVVVNDDVDRVAHEIAELVTAVFPTVA